MPLIQLLCQSRLCSCELLLDNTVEDTGGNFLLKKHWVLSTTEQEKFLKALSIHLCFVNGVVLINMLGPTAAASAPGTLVRMAPPCSLTVGGCTNAGDANSNH
jgi:hypothetical protein